MPPKFQDAWPETTLWQTGARPKVRPQPPQGHRGGRSRSRRRRLEELDVKIGHLMDEINLDALITRTSCEDVE